MKIFTLLTQILKNLTGQTSRNLAFKSLKPKAQSLKPNTVLNYNVVVPQLNTSVQNMMVPVNDAIVSVENKVLPVQSADVPASEEKYSVEYKIFPVQSADVPASEEKYSVEYKILSVQKKITPVQKIKPVVCKTFSPS